MNEKQHFSFDVNELDVYNFGDFGLVEMYLSNMHHDDYATLCLCEQFDITMIYLGWDPVFTGAY